MIGEEWLDVASGPALRDSETAEARFVGGQALPATRPALVFVVFFRFALGPSFGNLRLLLAAAGCSVDGR